MRGRTTGTSGDAIPFLLLSFPVILLIVIWKRWNETFSVHLMMRTCSGGGSWVVPTYIYIVANYSRTNHYSARVQYTIKNLLFPLSSPINIFITHSSPIHLLHHHHASASHLPSHNLQVPDVRRAPLSSNRHHPSRAQRRCAQRW